MLASFGVSSGQKTGEVLDQVASGRDQRKQFVVDSASVAVLRDGRSAGVDQVAATSHDLLLLT